MHTQNVTISIEKFLNPYKNAGKLALAISGGADSMCLAYLLHQWAIHNHVELIGIIIDHKLRPESTKEAKKVAKFLNHNGLITHILTWDGVKPKSNIQSLARAARYSLLTAFCKKHNIKYLLTGHNKDDQAETVLMRIFRGTGIDGLCGISKIQEFNEVVILRPLLEHTRKDIEYVLTEAKWKWVIDSSNFNERYDRVKIRNLIAGIPEKELIVERLTLLAKNSQRAKSALDKEVKTCYSQSCNEGIYGQITLDITHLLGIEEEIVLRLITTLLKKVSGNIYPPRLISVELLYNLINTEPKFTRTLWGCVIIKNNNNIIFLREVSAVETFKKLVPKQENIWDNRYKITLANRNLFIGPIQNEGLKILKSWVDKKSSLPAAKILYATPGIFNLEKKLIYYPILNLGIIKPKDLNFQIL